jgi:large subunit ribosomal protein L7A
MPLEVLRLARLRTVGLRQTMKAVQKGLAQTVFVAGDADERIMKELLGACRAGGVAVVEASSMSALGKACGIDVGAAAAAIVKEEERV